MIHDVTLADSNMPPRPLPRRGAIIIRLVRVALLAVGARAQCPNRCSGHGMCDALSRCDCFDGWQGSDCSLRSCARGNAWVDVASGTDTAHAPAECSNMGHCDYATGLCTCATGFDGLACERMLCPNDCSLHGQCMSLATAAIMFDGYRLNHSTQYTTAQWDAHMIHGCVCDLGFTGHDCSQRECPRGDDVRTIGQRNEVATLYCVCPPPCDGSFNFQFKGRRTRDIAHDASNATLANALMELTSIHSNLPIFDVPPITVVMDRGDRACDKDGVRSKIYFNIDAGDVPPLVVTSKLSTGARVANASALMETVQVLNCSCHGKCGGSFTLTYDRETTAPIPYNASNGTIANALLALESLDAGDLRVSKPSSGNGFCGDDVNRSTRITFTMAAGNQPPLVAVSSLTERGGSRGEQISVRTDDGTKESAYCNECGSCNHATGECVCEQGFVEHKTNGPCGRVRYNTSAWAGLETVRVLLVLFRAHWPSPSSLPMFRRARGMRPLMHVARLLHSVPGMGPHVRPVAGHQPQCTLLVVD